MTTTRSTIVVRPRVYAKPRHAADREDVEHDGGEQADRVRRQDRAAGTEPAALDRRAQRAAVAHLVAQPFEVDDEGVGGDADRHDQPGYPGQGQGESLGLAEQAHGGVGDRRGDAQRGDDHDAESPVVEEAVNDHQQEADGAREEAAAELVGTEQG